ncbi:MAG: type IV pilin protein [Pseudomonadales bacterium]
MRARGFTLVELMIAVAILAIIAAVAMPLYTQYSLRTFRSGGQADLLDCAQGMERFAARNFSYQGAADTDGDGIGDANAGPVAAEICTPDSAAAGRYTFTVNAPDANTFTLTATPDGQMAANNDGFMTYDSAGVRGWDQDNSGGIDAAEQTWEE